MTKSKHIGIGVMSGTSLDGLDLACCEFSRENEKWSFEVLEAKTFEYDLVWEQKLKKAPKLTAIELLQLDRDFGQFIGNKINSFITNYKLSVDFIASHGHTVFHQPEKGVTLQIGYGPQIAAKSGIKTIYDFRTLDVALGGQGAPLVPIGDELLFSEYDYCINLGGFSNISFRENHERIAFDICPVNIVLNQLHPPYDAYGKAGKQGQVDLDLLHQLNEIEYYNQPFPKSLGKEWLDDVFIGVINSSKISFLSKLRTIYEHVAFQISKYLKDKDKKALITGGGAHNTFLIELLKARSEANIVIPSNKVVDFKEALVFAFLGLLRILEKTNIYSSATGAQKDSCSGLICLP